MACLQGGRGGGVLGCSSTPSLRRFRMSTRPAEAVQGSVNGITFSHAFISAWHGTLRYFVVTVTCHCLCASRVL